MAIELKIPTVGESITEVVIGEWYVQPGQWVAQDDPVVIIETDKVNMDLPAPEAGVVQKIILGEGESAEVGDVVGLFEPGAAPAGAKPPAAAAEAAPAPATAKTAETVPVSPAAQRALADAGLDASQVEGTGRGGRILKEDVQRAAASAPPTPPTPTPAATPAPPSIATAQPAPAGPRQQEVVKLTPLRRTVARRLVEAQQQAALLTTFNEVDMTAIKALRKQYQDTFVKKYGIKLGFMSFFVKAAIEALKEVPGVNAELRGDQIVYHNYQDIGIAVGGGKGLVVPIIRNAERLSFAEVEQTIGELAQRARANRLKLEELQGGTFTISNGGIYGSLLSTPIVNPPQSGILGLHKIEDRPIALNGEVVIRPMMYLALTYDHRLVDGREAVTFLVRVKERIEDPTRILLEV